MAKEAYDADSDSQTDHHFLSQFEAWATEEPEEPIDPKNGMQQAAEYIASETAAWVWDGLNNAAKKTESPIELLMLNALSCEIVRAGYDVFYRVDKSLSGVTTCGIHRCIIEPQAVIGKHRADFSVEIGRLLPSRDLKRREWIWYSGKLIIECDGHDFHEKTKEQAQRDKQRDRTLARQRGLSSRN